MEEYKFLMSLLFGVFKRISMLYSHDEEIEKLKEAANKNQKLLDHFKEFMEEIERKERIFTGIEIDKGKKIQKQLISEFYKDEVKQVLELSIQNNTLEMADRITDSLILDHYSHYESVHRYAATDPELIRIIIQSMQTPSEEIKRMYRAEWIKNVLNTKDQNRSGNLKALSKQCAMEHYTLFSRELSKNIKIANKVKY